jgi:hypothetical protein
MCTVILAQDVDPIAVKYIIHNAKVKKAWSYTFSSLALEPVCAKWRRETFLIPIENRTTFPQSPSPSPAHYTVCDILVYSLARIVMLSEIVINVTKFSMFKFGDPHEWFTAYR